MTEADTGPQETTETDAFAASGQFNQELKVMANEHGDQPTTEEEAAERLTVFEGLSVVEAGQLGPEDKYRFLITAALQTSPTELGTWLDGKGEGFTATDRPVNTSLIDQDHTCVFGGGNGFILEPPALGSDVIAATAQDVGSSGFDVQTISLDADALLAATNKMGFNQITIRSGRLQGVYIRKTTAGDELGRTGANDELRQFAEHHDLPVVEIVVAPQQLVRGEPMMGELPAHEGNRLWKINLPENDRLREVYIVRFKPGEKPKGFQLDANGFDIGVRDLDAYGSDTYAMNDPRVLGEIMDRLTAAPI